MGGVTASGETTHALQSRLTAYFARRDAEPPTGLPGPLTALTGGWASSLYTFQRGEPGDAPGSTSVLKMYAPDPQGREHATREWRALTGLHAVGYPVPRGVLLELDAHHLGQPFIMMDHVPGTSLWQVAEATDPTARARLTRSFVAMLVQLHALDPQLLEPALDLVHSYGYIDRELQRLRRDSTSSPHARIGEVVQWLEKRRDNVPCHRPVILHRDYHPWNVVVDPAEHLWVIDWDWHIGDARFDVAWTTTLMQRSGFQAFSDTVRDEYARQTGDPLGEFAYFEVLTTIRWLLNVLPSVDSDARSGAAARADFRAFLIEPVRKAEELLEHRAGISLNIRV